MKPFSDNIIFWDTEFSSLDPYKGEILSIGMVKPDGSELYMELEHEGYVDPWVVENQLPYMTAPKISRQEAVKKMFAFIGDTKPYLVAYVNQFDTVYLYKLLNVQTSTKDFPFNWMQMDIASMLFGAGIDPQKFNIKKPGNLAEQFGIDYSKYKEHNALDDAKLLREIYLKLCSS